VAAYVTSVESARGVEHGRAMALAALVSASAGLTALLSRLRTAAARLVVVATLGSAILFVHTPGLAGLLHLSPLHLGDWALVVAGSLLALAPLAIDRRTSRAASSTAASASAGVSLLDPP
jgi:Ca2+-transporting ATPase